MKRLNKEEIIDTYGRLIISLGKIPTVLDFRKHGYKSLEYSINKEFGKISSLRKVMNLPSKKKDFNHWTLTQTVASLKKFIRENRKALQTTAIGNLLHQKGCYNIYYAAQKFGGIRRMNEAYNLGLDLPLKDYWTEETIVQQIKEIHARCSKITENAILLKGPRGFMPAIKRLGSLEYFVKKAGLTLYSYNKWTEKMILEKYLSIYKSGKLPTSPKLQELGYVSLIQAIRNKYGSMQAFRKKFGFMGSKKPANYWTLKNVLRELRQFTKDHPDFKESSNLELLTLYKRMDLKLAIYKFKGLGYLNKKYGLGLKVNHQPITKKALLKELQMLVDQGHSITQKSLRTMNRNDLLFGTIKYGGLNTIKQQLGLSINRHKYWNNERILKQLKPLVKVYGRIPSSPVFKALSKSDLYRAYEKRGGCKVYGPLLNACSKGYYTADDGHYLQSAYECLFDNLLHKYGIPHQVHGFISEKFKYRYDFLINGHYFELCGYTPKEHHVYHNRLRKKIRLYKKLKLPFTVIYKKTLSSNIVQLEKKVIEKLQTIISISLTTVSIASDITGIRPVSHWADIEKVKKALRPLVKKYNRMPLDKEFRKEQMTSVLHGIYRYHGSPYKLGQQLNLTVRYKPKGFYTETNAVEEYKQLCSKAGRFLSQGDLAHLKLHGLNGYVGKNGGMEKFRQLTQLPFKQVRIPKGYYTPEKAAEEYKELCVRHNKFLSSKELYKLKANALANYIQTHGGYYPVREKTELTF